ncbi:MAG: DUF5060 domain-containing protein, partial [Omnitrophica WOR_2 bacterium]
SATPTRLPTLMMPTDTSTPVPTPTPPPVKPFSYLALLYNPGSVKVYDRVELTIATDGVVTNPFDPTQANLQVEFSSDGDRIIVIPAFYYQEFDRRSLQPVGDPVWKVRFTPTQAGTWLARAALYPSDLRSKTIRFDVLPNPGAHGFVRQNQRNPLYFQTDNGDFFFPVGLNIGWAGGDVLGDYQHWLDHFSQNGGNLVRVWMADWSFGLEWKDTGLGDYSKRMKQAWLLDQVFHMAEERGVTIMLSLLNHGAFNETVNPEWSDNPYNARLGGPLAQPHEFVTDPSARQLFKRRLRYIAARWSYSPSLFAWEWWNEINWTPVTTEMLRPWLSEMTGYLRTVDPYQHLVTHSTSSADPIWDDPEIQICQLHDYSGQFFPTTLSSTFDDYQELAPGKPVLMGEFGYNAGGEDKHFLQQSIHLHNGLWTAPFVGFAGTGMYWWWDNYIDPYDHWHEFRSISDFFRGEDLADMHLKRARVQPYGASAFILQNDRRALVWVINNTYSMEGAQSAYLTAFLNKKLTPDWRYVPQAMEKVVVTVSGLTDGHYLIDWYAPSKGMWLAQGLVTVSQEAFSVTIPSLQTDVAFKLHK